MGNRKTELICEVMEAVEKVNAYRPLYLAVLKATGDRKQAAAAVKFVARIERNMERDQ